MKISVTTQMIVQILMMAAQIGNFMVDVLPPDTKPMGAAGLALIQAVVGYLGHHSNPDGTDVRAAYVKPTKTQSIS